MESSLLLHLPGLHYRYGHQAQPRSTAWCCRSIPEREEVKNEMDDQDGKVERYWLVNTGLSRNIQTRDSRSFGLLRCGWRGQLTGLFAVTVSALNSGPHTSVVVWY